MRIIFFGSSHFVIPIIDVLRKNFELSLVVTTEKLASQGETLRSCTVINYCIKNNIAYISLKQFSNETMQQLNNIHAPVAVLADFGIILPNDALNLFPKGIINVHPSLLPLYRGPTPSQTAILNGDKKTGATLIKLDNEVDHGPILAQVTQSMLPNDTSETLYERLFAIGARLLEENINDYLNNKITLKEQDHKNATFTNHLTRQSGYIDLANPPTTKILDRMIRAYYPWPGVWTRLQGDPLQNKILKFLPDKKLQVEGKRPVSYKDFVNGYPEAKEMLKKLE